MSLANDNYSPVSSSQTVIGDAHFEEKLLAKTPDELSSYVDGIFDKLQRNLEHNSKVFQQRAQDLVQRVAEIEGHLQELINRFQTNEPAVAVPSHESAVFVPSNSANPSNGPSAGMLAMERFKVALIQLAVGSNKARNLENACLKIAEASRNQADLVVLPHLDSQECFNSPYGTKYFAEYAEPVPHGPTSLRLSQAAKEHSIWLVGGSIPERRIVNNEPRLYNTCAAFDPQGHCVTTYSKIHLFDIDIPGKITFRESDAISPGDRLGIFPTKFGNIGIGICYDLRFPELALLAARDHEAVMMVYPGAFNMTTGPLHWKLLQAARAVDYQLFVASASPARIPDASYQAWGHSMLIDPMGTVLAEADETECIIYGNVDLGLLRETRRSIPVFSQRRADVYYR